MNAPLTVECEVHFSRRGHGAQKVLVPGPEPIPAPPRVPRVAKLMALALRYDEMVRKGEVEDFDTLARLGRVTRARMSQIMALVNSRRTFRNRCCSCHRSSAAATRSCWGTCSRSRRWWIGPSNGGCGSVSLR